MRYLWKRRFPSKNSGGWGCFSTNSKSRSLSNSFRVELLLNEMIEYKTI
jgi:hypothetical protein